MRDYKKIKAFELADKLVLAVYGVTEKFPRREIFGIVSQLRRAAVSVPTNIVEGASRKYKKEYLQFLYIAKGSLSEVEYLLYLSKNLQFLEDKEYTSLYEKQQEVAKTLYGLISSVEKET